jgi:heptosyltransferase III
MRILIVHTSGRIGDTLLATPAIAAIRSHYPNSSITVLANKNTLPCLQNNPAIDMLKPFHRKTSALSAFLKPNHYEMAFVFCGIADDKTSQLSYARRAAKKVCAFATDAIADRTVDVSVPGYIAGEHVVDHYLRLPATLGIEATSRRIVYQPTRPETDKAARVLGELVPAAGLLIGLKLTSLRSKPYRDWPMQNFISLCALISRTFPDTQYLLFGSTEDEQAMAAFVENFPSRAHSVASNDIRQTAAIMSKIDFYIGVDTGPTHLMSSFDIPLVVLYHCLSPSTYVGPLEHPCATLIDHATSASGCNERTPLAEISVETVFNGFLRSVDQHGAGKAGDRKRRVVP